MWWANLPPKQRADGKKLRKDKNCHAQDTAKDTQNYKNFKTKMKSFSRYKPDL